MELLSRDLPLEHQIYLTSDWHIGSSLSDIDRIRQIVDEVGSTKNTYIALGGDQIEAILSDDKRFQMDNVDDRAALPILQANFIVDLLTPLKKDKKILFILSGNHEWSLQRYGDLTKDIICKQLEVPYGSYTAKMVIKNNGRRQYGIFYTHGAKSLTSTADDPIRAESNMKLSLKRRLQNKMGDCEVMCSGHNHKLLVIEPTTKLYLAGDSHIKQHYTGPGTGNYIHPDHRWYGSTGTICKLYGKQSGYAERAGYDPAEYGYCLLTACGTVEKLEKIVI